MADFLWQSPAESMGRTVPNHNDAFSVWALYSNPVHTYCQPYASLASWRIITGKKTFGDKCVFWQPYASMPGQKWLIAKYLKGGVMKKVITLLAVMGILCGMALFCGTVSAADKPIIIKIAGHKPEGEPETGGIHQFGKYLGELSKASMRSRCIQTASLARKIPT